MSNDYTFDTVSDQFKSRARTQRNNTRSAYKRQRREKNPESRHWRKWTYNNNGFARRTLSCRCCPKKYADRRKHGNHTCNGNMKDMCPVTHGLRVKQRMEGNLEVIVWRKVDYNEESFCNYCYY
ncbi:hypothetical protein I4U23_015587 [Adineta vaga]|nr:hypothetical protein I4U23_015587 [Adineta vaga]